MKKILPIFILFFALNSFSQSISAEGGAGYFLGNLRKEIGAYPYINGTFEYGISNIYGIYLSGAYSFLNLKVNNDFEMLHQFLGRAGLKTSNELCGFCEYVSVGGGISIAFVRGKGANSNAENYMLSDNESEFGWHLLLETRVLQTENFVCGARFYYDRIWTIPKNSDVMQGGVFAGYKF